MKSFIFSLLGAAVIVAGFKLSPAPPIEVLFSPKGGIEKRVVQEINNASKKIIVEAYTLTNKNIINALLQAKKRNVNITIVLDGKYGVQSSEKYLTDLKDDLLIDSQESSHGGISHIKCIIIDDTLAMTGSFNWTGQAETKNHEDIFIITSQAEVKKLIDDAQKHIAHSTK